MNKSNNNEETLSIHIISKNEENQIKNLLESISKINYSHIYVCDNNSIDDTKKIVSEFGGIIIDYPKEEEFSFPEARNILIQESQSKYNLWIDCDECISLDSVELINSNLKNGVFNRCDFHFFKHRNKTILFDQMRLWKNNKDLLWCGNVHEKIKGSDAKGNFLIHNDIEILEENTGRKEKNIRNMLLAEKEIKNSPSNISLILTLAVYKNMFNEFKSSEAYCIQYINNPMAQIQGKSFALYLLGWIYFFQYQNIQGAINYIFQSIYFNPDSKESWCLLGDIFSSIKDYKKALSFYNNCISVSKISFPQKITWFENEETVERALSQIEKINKVTLHGAVSRDFPESPI